MSDDQLHERIEAVREARREIARWRDLKRQLDRDGDYESWERAGRELVHWTYVEQFRSRELVDALLALQEPVFTLTPAGRAAVQEHANGTA